MRHRLRIGKNCPHCGQVATNDMVRGTAIVCSGCGSIYTIARPRPSTFIFLAGLMTMCLIGAGLYLVSQTTSSLFANHFSYKGLSEADARALLRECQAKNYSDCVENGYRYLDRISGGDEFYAANFAMTLTRNKKFDVANSVYERLIESGVGTYDLFAWYARNLRGLGDIEAAIEWYENSLSVEPDTVDVTSELASAYISEQRPWEAASLLASFIHEHPNTEGIFSAKLLLAREKITSDASEQTDAVLLVSNTRGHFMFPLHWGNHREAQMYLVDTGASLLVMPSADYEKIPSTMKSELGVSSAKIADSRSIDIQMAIVSSLWIGKWQLSNVRVGYCDSCQRLAGMSLLKNFDMSYSSNGKLAKLVVQFSDQ